MYTETSGSALKKKCRLIRNLNYSLDAVKKVCKLAQKKHVLECMQIFPASRPTSTSISEWWWWWGRGEGSSLIFWSGVSNMIQEPLAFTTPCSAAILLP